MIAAFNAPDDDPPEGGTGGGGSDEESSEPENKGTLILDATCAPQNISFPQDITLLNETRENLEHIIDDICYQYNYYTPRMNCLKRLQKILSLR